VTLKINPKVRANEARKKKRSMDAYMAWATNMTPRPNVREACAFHAGFNNGYKMAMEQVRRFSFDMGASP
jgi:hypothetical protein